MNEQLQSALVEILNKTMNGIDSSVAFMQAELPDVIQQLLLWYAAKSAIFALIGLILLFVMVALDKKAFKHFKGESYSSDDLMLIWGVMGSVVRIIYMLPIALITDLGWLQIWIAPKIWLIEYAANLAK